ncbi:hypothetical protein EJ377_18465 [Chryseobacterium arthrosphaerae]|uniref:Beta-lactamase-related domain-containing protein n=1 Tax=Chryseobacterium arthrosphaerae TaxID=651561 RepID=A0A432DTA7_9FLAO|nr:hypothetical protein EJ377_18465 [Chryseobacterium arthrosphaerae]
MLENIYGKSYETLLKENIFSKAGMNHTKLELGKNEAQANGYHENFRLMPVSQSLLWEQAARKPNLQWRYDEVLKEELNPQDKIVQESQRNIDNSKEDWYGYFWINILLPNMVKQVLNTADLMDKYLVYHIS